MTEEKADEFTGAPLTEQEIRLIRRVVRDQQRMDWLWATLRVWVGWAVAISTAVYAAYDPILRMLKAGLNIK